MKIVPENIFYNLNTVEYNTSGDSVDWLLLIDDTEQVIYLMFQGSNQKRDWQNNFNFPAKVYKNQQSCMIFARGWGDAWRSCNDEIMEIVIRITNERPDYEFVICGHSLGGAMAILATEDFYYRTEEHPILVTFGAPKPCFGRKTTEYIKWCCDNQVYQYADRNDLVTFLPPFPGYKHIRKIKIGKRFSFKKLFNPIVYHMIYGDEDLYKKAGK